MTAYIFKKWYLLNTLDLMKGKVKALLDTEYFFYLETFLSGCFLGKKLNFIFSIAYFSRILRLPHFASFTDEASFFSLLQC